MTRLRAFFAPMFVRQVLTMVIVTASVIAIGSAPFLAAYGAVLQLVAIYVVAREFSTALHVFVPGKLHADAALWWGSVKSGSGVKLTVGVVEAGNAQDFTSASIGWTPLPVAGTVDQKVEAMRVRLEGITSNLTTLSKSFADDVKQRQIDSQAQKLAVKDAIGKVKDDVQKVAVSDPWTSLFGILCLALGVFLNGFASYIV
jgi:hypothetical protein